MPNLWLLATLFIVISLSSPEFCEALGSDPGSFIIRYRADQAFRPLYSLENKSTMEAYPHIVFQSPQQNKWFWTLKTAEMQKDFHSEPKSAQFIRLGFRDVVPIEKNPGKESLVYQFDMQNQTFVTGDKTNQWGSVVALNHRLTDQVESRVAFSLQNGKGYNPIDDVYAETKRQIDWGLQWNMNPRGTISFGAGYDFHSEAPLNYTLAVNQQTSDNTEWHISSEFNGSSRQWDSLAFSYAVNDPNSWQAQWGLGFNPNLGKAEDLTTRFYYGFGNAWTASISADYNFDEQKIHYSEVEFGRTLFDRKIRFTAYLDEHRYFLYCQWFNGKSWPFPEEE